MGKIYSHKRPRATKKESASLFFQSRRSGRSVVQGDWEIDPDFDKDPYPASSYLHETAVHAVREGEKIWG